MILAILFTGTLVCFTHTLTDCKGNPETFLVGHAFELLVEWKTPTFYPCNEEECRVEYLSSGEQTWGWAGEASIVCMSVPEVVLEPDEVQYVRVRAWNVNYHNSDEECKP